MFLKPLFPFSLQQENIKQYRPFVKEFSDNYEGNTDNNRQTSINMKNFVIMVRLNYIHSRIM